jgi:hypothetical protein
MSQIEQRLLVNRIISSLSYSEDDAHRPPSHQQRFNT